MAVSLPKTYMEAEGYGPRTKPRIIEMLQKNVNEVKRVNTKSIAGKEVAILDLPDLKVIGWENKTEDGIPYPDVWSHVFGDFDIDSKFDSIPSKIQDSGAYLGLFHNLKTVPDSWDEVPWDTGFFLGVQVENFDKVPDGLATREYKAMKYATFSVKGVPDAALSNTWDFIHKEWLPKFPYEYNAEGVLFINFTEKSGPDDERFEAHLVVPVKEK